MSLWTCADCGGLYIAGTYVCPKCGALLHFADLHFADLHPQRSSVASQAVTDANTAASAPNAGDSGTPHKDVG